MSNSEQRIRLPARLVWTRYNVVDRTLDRWVNDPKLNFPKPIVINKRRYFFLDEIEAWERQPARKHSASSTRAEDA